jgi:hypothetical protein
MAEETIPPRLDGNKTTNAVRTAAWRAAHPGRAKAHQERWRKENREKIKAQHKAWRERNREKVRAKYHASKASDEAQNRRADYRRKNKLAIMRRHKIWRDRNPDKTAAHRKAWRKANPERTRALSNNRRAIKRGADGHYTVADIRRILKLQRHRCAYCPRSLRSGYHVDHIIALAKGGTNWPRNIQCLCPSCNVQKHTKDPIIFAREHGRLL